MTVIDFAAERQRRRPLPTECKEILRLCEDHIHTGIPFSEIESRHVLQSYFTATARKHAERTHYKAEVYCSVARTVEEFGAFISNDEDTLVQAFWDTCDQGRLSVGEWTELMEDDIVAAFRRRLDELFTTTGGGDAA